MGAKRRTCLQRTHAAGPPPDGGEARFSIAIPQLDSDSFDGAGLRKYLVRAEELGFEGGWVPEQIIGRGTAAGPAGAAGVLRGLQTIVALAEFNVTDVRGLLKCPPP
ncbi:flavin-dependent oxidoreductase [Mycobacterium haemophilum DSM 44634]